MNRTLSVLFLLIACGDKADETDGAGDADPTVDWGDTDTDTDTDMDTDMDTDTDTDTGDDPMDADGDGSDASEDCDDDDPDVHPGADERCDGVDNDCDDEIDEDDAVDADTFHVDADGDGFGDPGATATACEQREGLTTDATDCDDSSADARPGGVEVCDRLDNDCDGSTDFDAWIPDDHLDVAAAVDAGAAMRVCVDAGTWDATGLEPSAALELEGVGIDQTILDGGDGPMFITDASLRLARMTLTNVGHTDETSSGAALYEGDGGLVLEELRFDAPDHAASYGAFAYVEGGDITVRDVEIDGPAVTTTGSWYGFFYTYEGALDVDGLDVHDGHFQGADAEVSSYGVLYTDGDEADVLLSNVSVRDNTFDFRFVYGLIYCEEDTYGDGTFEDLHASGNDVVASATFYGALSLDDFEGDVRVMNVSIVGNTLSYGQGTYGWLGYSEYSSGVSLSNLLIAGNHQEAVDTDAPGRTIYDWVGPATGENWTIAHNTLGADTDGPAETIDLSGDWTLRNLDITGNDGLATGTLVSADGTLDIDHVNVSEQVEPTLFADSSGERTAATALAGDPLYTDVTGSDPTDWDLTLQSTSPLIDAGDPTILDADGSTSDIGAYGGPLGGSW
jgi:hypothetical protein